MESYHCDFAFVEVLPLKHRAGGAAPLPSGCVFLAVNCAAGLRKPRVKAEADPPGHIFASTSSQTTLKTDALSGK